MNTSKPVFSSCKVQRVHLYLSDVIRSYGQEVDLVSQALGGLDCGNVGVDQNRLDVLLLESLNSLRSKTNSTGGLTACWGPASVPTATLHRSHRHNGNVPEPKNDTEPPESICATLNQKVKKVRPGSQNSRTPQPGRWIALQSPG